MFYCYWGCYQSSWSTLRGFNWEYSISYTIHKLTDLFCLTILFSKFNILASFILHFFATHWPILPYNLFCQIQHFSKFYPALSCKYWGIHPNKIFQWSKGPIKYTGKLFVADGGQTVLGKFIGTLFNMRGLMIRSIANHEGIYTWRWSPDKSTELWKYLFLKLIVESFQRLCHG